MEDNETEIELRIHGMDCAEEVTLLKRELIPLLGDEDRLGFDLLNGKLTVDTSSLDVTHGDVLAAIQRTGLKSEPWQDDGAANDDLSFWQQHQRSILTTVSGLFGLSGLVVQLSAGESESVPLSAIVPYSVGIVAGLLMVLPKAWRSLVSLASRHEPADVGRRDRGGLDRRMVRGCNRCVSVFVLIAARIMEHRSGTQGDCFVNGPVASDRSRSG